MVEEMRSIGIHRDEKVLSLLATLYGRHGKIDKLKQLISEMNSLSLNVNNHVYAALIRAYGNNGNNAEHEAVLSLMKEEGKQPSTEVFAAMAEFRNSDENQELLKMMKKEGVNPDGDWFTSAFYGALQFNADSHGLIVLSSMMDKAQLIKDERAYATLLYGFNKLKDIPNQTKTFEKMKADRVTPSRITHIAMQWVGLKKWLVTKRMEEHEKVDVFHNYFHLGNLNPEWLPAIPPPLEEDVAQMNSSRQKRTKDRVVAKKKSPVRAEL